MNEIQKFESEIIPIVEETKNLIVSGETYEYAANLQINIRKKRKEIQDFFKPMKDKAFAAHREICNQETKIIKPLNMADTYLNPKITAYHAEEERKRKEKEMELQREAQKIVEAEAMARAEDAEKAGDHAAAEAILENESTAAPVIVVPDTPRVDGLHTRQIWKWKIVDAKKINPDFLIPDEKKITAVVRSMKKQAERLVGGIEVYPEAITAVRVRV